MKYNIPIVWVDFNDIENGETWTLLRWFPEQTKVAPGDIVLAQDGDGLSCGAQVIEIVGQLVRLKLSM